MVLKKSHLHSNFSLTNNCEQIDEILKEEYSVRLFDLAYCIAAVINNEFWTSAEHRNHNLSEMDIVELNEKKRSLKK